MFGFRSDGKKLKKVDPILRFTSYVMKKRYDSQVEMVKDIRCEEIDRFIKERLAQGIKYTYMHVFIAGIVRMYALRPKLNRFVMNGRIYRREKIYISFAIKRHLSDEGEETTLKIGFTGKETLLEIKDMIDSEIAKNSADNVENKTDKFARGFLKMPHFILNPAFGMVKLMDKWGILPKSVIELSPFHTSCFVTNMKSIGAGYVYHHLYDLGTTGLFVAIGKERFEPCIDMFGNVEVGKVVKLGLVVDERICDGLYYSKSVRVGSKYISNPSLLEEPLEELPVDPEA